MPPVDPREYFPEAEPEGVQVTGDERGLGDAQDAVAAAVQSQAAWRRFSDGQPLIARSADERAMLADASNAYATTMGVDSAALAEILRKPFTGIQHVANVHIPVYAPRPKPVVGQGMFWWAETRWWTPGDRIGLYAYFDDAAGGVRFVGQQDYDDGDLWKGSAGATATFGIGTDRLPSPGVYRSAPSTDLHGELLGFTTVNGPWSFGDNWCKCWLHVDQTVRTTGGAIIANGHDARQVIFFEDDGSFGVVPLPGFLPFPPLQFYVGPGQPLTATLELKFDFQLEGGAMIRFGNFGGLVPALFRTPQWSLTPV